MPCSACGARSIAFTVPADLRAHAPGEGAAATICSRCLRTQPADEGAADPEFDAILPAFPSGEAGAALALALGLLDSLALRRDGIDDCCSYAERAGADVLLTLDRLVDAEDVEPHVDLSRRRHQLAELLR
ncbi:hypothetical protein SAMN04488065_1453 [Haloplanus vescus]|uniref:Small CPxCG-related zinc finger protein n=1 Tax=Haloplanus vescus TaxID=555874 RepID=A0A1H3XBT3_9EURY|nr:DUF6276 family protein [Haloplanus vescus]SDZ96401.1 hypothetical protein SAMN04488065_1453 [Haloplanus vescus]